MPTLIHIQHRNLMVEIWPTDFSGKCISWIIGDLEMPVYATVVGINKAVAAFTEKAFTRSYVEGE